MFGEQGVGLRSKAEAAEENGKLGDSERVVRSGRLGENRQYHCYSTQGLFWFCRFKPSVLRIPILNLTPSFYTARPCLGSLLFRVLLQLEI